MRRYRNGKLQVRGNALRPVRHVRHIQELANSATAHSSLLPDHYFIWDPTEPVATRPLAWNLSTVQPFNSSTFFYTHDGNKNVSEVIASAGTLAAHYEYAPFGALIVSRGGSAAANPWRFSSEFADYDVGVDSYTFRSYNPYFGLWISRDIFGELGGKCLVRFLDNNSISKFDFLGWMDRSECQKAVDDALASSVSVKSLVNAISKLKCDIPSVECACCEANANGQTKAGYYERPRWLFFGNNITICNNVNCNVDAVSIEQTLFHELVHALQNCRDKLKSSCDGVICAEVQAYYRTLATCHPELLATMEDNIKLFIMDGVIMSSDEVCAKTHPDSEERKRYITQYVKDHFSKCKSLTR